MNRRGSGVLLHITSLPSSYGIGDLGPRAYQFADFLAETKQSYWQILPLNPTSTSLENSPYNSFSAFAGNPLLINPDLLVRDGFLSASDISNVPHFCSDSVDYKKVTDYKDFILRKTYEKNREKLRKDFAFQQFCDENADWLDVYALYKVLKEQFHDTVWSEWPVDLRDGDERTLKRWEEKLRDRILLEKFFQFIFFKQWFSLKKYCNSKNLQIIGDIPIYVSYDSADVWMNPEVFKLNEERMPSFVAGAPPDYFSAKGQLWGTPVYEWNGLKETGYKWWIKRFEHNLKLFDMVRLDHFRGFVAYWEVGASEETAILGRWVEAPSKDFFHILFRHFPYLPIIAEDLGFITPDVREIMNLFGFPGMRVLLFAFGEDMPHHSYIPHNFTKNSVVYTGTHDNNTVRGWFAREASDENRERLSNYVGRNISEEMVHWELIRLGMMSVANMVISPMQDVLGLGEEARMNLPATSEGNWEWRLIPEQITPRLVDRLAEMTETYGRG